MLFHAFKMAVSIASLRVNASDQIQPLNLHFLDQALFFQIYIDGPPGVPGVSKNQNFISTYESVHFLADKTYRIGFLGFQVWVFGGSSSSVLVGTKGMIMVAQKRLLQKCFCIRWSQRPSLNNLSMFLTIFQQLTSDP